MSRISVGHAIHGDTSAADTGGNSIRETRAGIEETRSAIGGPCEKDIYAANAIRHGGG